MSVQENFADIYLRGMLDRSMRSGTELAGEIQLTDWSTAGNLSNRSSGVQIPRDICTRFGRYLYSTKCSWIINRNSRQEGLLRCAARDWNVPIINTLIGNISTCLVLACSKLSVSGSDRAVFTAYSRAHLTDRCSTSGHESFLSSSPYILNRILNIQAKLEVSCFKRFGLDLPLKPDKKTHRLITWREISSPCDRILGN